MGEQSKQRKLATDLGADVAAGLSKLRSAIVEAIADGGSQKYRDFRTRARHAVPQGLTRV